MTYSVLIDHNNDIQGPCHINDTQINVYHYCDIATNIYDMVWRVCNYNDIQTSMTC